MKGRVVDRAQFEAMKKEYYGLRKWDTATGLPTESRLKELRAGRHRGGTQEVGWIKSAGIGRIHHNKRHRNDGASLIFDPHPLGGSASLDPPYIFRGAIHRALKRGNARGHGKPCPYDDPGGGFPWGTSLPLRAHGNAPLHVYRQGVQRGYAPLRLFWSPFPKGGLRGIGPWGGGGDGPRLDPPTPSRGQFRRNDRMGA